MTSRLEGKIALITGAARGIGRAQAVRFAEEGADIIAIDVCTSVETTVTPPATEADLAETVVQIQALGRKVESAVVDVRDLEALRSAVDSAVEALGGLDIVCATAGITSSDGALTMSETMWQTMLDVNLTGVWHTTTVAAPHLIERGGGSMTLTSSIAGLRGLVGVAHYTAAKHGVVGLMRSLAKELAPYNVRVNTVHPTNVDTLMIQNPLVRGKFRPDLENPTREEFAAAAMTMNMLAIPWIEPVDVANAALFLSSDEARYITSVALPVDAGSSSR
ncbi:MAG: mycofactocin-coupled SDR family oxidoreductase [Rhodococcus sp. (in: high G+C Gram-positive bacteria)]|uniref:mycofactocin-coupled SDR family oxidoreductase n=1 Tax=Rhodococcus TaxID=1827 RepID=UPI001E51CB1D|nr:MULTISPECIES: mycofactocin-coupled SDR family oxidoreductase [Rhodococcus erythropolis group]MCD2107676.1 mycofactocin-coupled SDR family oxidoreductase [Rhodococcus qingshengii]MCZ4524876.1 mycofactocin-coupled SDR family oxidoreductase [Rhodococcus erythropolis]MDZ7911410.1 mycofactocin-coupled SDR family oxidoreductase [Rhodococcus sp. (in: high G+C Gram-positive bacteria)]